MELILEKTLVLTSDQTKTHVSVSFELEKDYETLEFYCEYDPKIVEVTPESQKLIQDALDECFPVEYRPEGLTWEKYLPLKNLITFSLDFGDKYLGCYHNQAPIQSHSISKNKSSLGFCKQEPLQGVYTAVINLQAVVSPRITYTLKVIAK